MTRRGSLVYYSASVVCGCFFAAICVWFPGGLTSSSWSRDFLGVYSAGLVTGALPALLFGLLLRRLTGILRCTRLWEWMVAGGALALLLSWGLGKLSLFEIGDSLRGLSKWWAFVFLGPAMFLAAGVWRAVPAGLATAFVLYHIHRAFGPRLDDPVERASGR